MKKRLLSLALALVMCLGLLPATASAAEGNLPDWYFLFAIFKNVDADGKDKNGKVTHIEYTMTQDEINTFRDNAREFEAYMNSVGVMRAHVDVVEIDTPVTELYNEGNLGAYLNAEKATPLLKGKVNLDQYDHVACIIALDDFATGYAAVTPPTFKNGTGTSCINSMNWNYCQEHFAAGSTPWVMQVYVHEFLHFMETMSEKWGGRFGLHDIINNSYLPNDDNKKACYTDIILNRARGNDGTGVFPAAWQYPPHTLRSTNGWTIPTGATKIVDWEFGHRTSLTRITIPASVTSIGYAAFWDTGIKDVYYGGTEKQWKAIEIGEFNGALTKAKIHYNSTSVNDQTTNPTNPSTTVSFTDVKQTDWFYSPVQWAVGKKITSGTTATTFSPKKECTVAEILTFLYQAYGAPEVSGNPYSNVKTSAWYANAAIWAHEKGLVTGSTFSASTPCTRSMAVEYLWKLAGRPEAQAAPFDDVPADASYAKAVNWAVAKGVTSGVSKTQFAPYSTCTRGQIVTFLYAALAK